MRFSLSDLFELVFDYCLKLLACGLFQDCTSAKMRVSQIVPTLRCYCLTCSPKVVEDTELGACEKIAPLFQGKLRYRTLGIGRVANEHELALPSYSNASRAFACPRSAPLNILKGRRMY